MSTKNTETIRLEEARDGKAPWKKWGPYLSERQWGTVREDYSWGGDAWDYFTHDQARSRTYRWGEDGIAGLSDDKQRLCFALALWNGQDPILKERLFGLTNSEGNHGEDVKEYYFYLDSTPTHSYMKFLYKYPQAAFPYADLVETNRRRNREEFEYELIDTGVFDGDRYFDVFVEYAKGGAEDILVQITAFNRGPEAAELHLLPTLWFRNDWAAWIARPAEEKPNLKQIKGPAGTSAVAAAHPVVGEYTLYCEGEVPLLFTDNETNYERVFGTPNQAPYVKDGINNCVVLGQQGSGEPREDRNQGGRPLPVHHRPRPSGDGAAAPHRPGRCRCKPENHTAAPPSVRSLTRPWPPGCRRRMSSTSPSPRLRSPRMRPMSCARPSPACSGPSSSTSSTVTNGWTSTTPTPSIPAAATSGTRSGTTW